MLDTTKDTKLEGTCCYCNTSKMSYIQINHTEDFMTTVGEKEGDWAHLECYIEHLVKEAIASPVRYIPEPKCIIRNDNFMVRLREKDEGNG